MEEWSLVDTPATLTHLIRQTAKGVGGATKNTPLASGMLFARINQMRAANEAGDVEAFAAAQDAALFEQGVLTALEAIRGDALSRKNLGLLLRGKIPRSVALPAAMAAAGLALVGGLKAKAPAPEPILPSVGPALDADAAAELAAAISSESLPAHSIL